MILPNKLIENLIILYWEAYLWIEFIDHKWGFKKSLNF